MLNPRHVTDGFSVAAQIAPEDLAELSQQGFTLVISNRPDGEEPGQPAAAEVAAAAAAAGLEFRHIPIAGGFPREAVDATAAALDGADGRVFAFCRSGTRSTLLWSLAQASRGADPKAIAAAAAAAGYDTAPVYDAMEQLAATS